MSGQWDNCTSLLLVPDAYPCCGFDCSQVDNLFLWIGSIVTFSYCCVFFGLLFVQLRRKWKNLAMRAYITVVFLVAVIATLLVQALFGLLWLNRVIVVHPWNSKLGYVELVHVSLYMSLISTKASSLFQIVYDSSRGRKTTSIGVLSWVCLVLAVVDPVVLTIYLLTVSLDEMWQSSYINEIVVVSLNTALIAALMYMTDQNKMSNVRYRRALLEIFVLNLFAISLVIISWLQWPAGHISQGVLGFWSFFQFAKTLPTFVCLCITIHHHECDIEKKPPAHNSAYTSQYTTRPNALTLETVDNLPATST
mmetsp:Transcript_34987/g.55968  ORF Transcript_34987/g.55968 Transcript_34987/m.55968 type:complete len:308 (+) Transcript_34987:114-1037(+)